MAAIDRIYLNSYNEYIQFRDWLLKQPKLRDKYGKEISLIVYFFNHWSKASWLDKNGKNVSHPVFSAPYYVDAYIIRNCPFDFVQEELKTNYGSDYEIIKKNKMYNKPYIDKYERGKHFTMIKVPDCYKGNICQRPMRGTWMIDIKLPDYVSEMYMNWHAHSHAKFPVGTWDFASEFVEAINSWASSATHCKTIDALKRRIPKWKLPIGTVVRAIGRYVGEKYEFVVTK